MNSDVSPLGKSFCVTLQLLSDWHVGSGGGQPGNIDSLVRRDADGLPYVPAKTLTGIWRDACERVALGLDNGNETGPWNQWVDFIFGDQPALIDAGRRDIGDPSETLDPESFEWKVPRPAALSIRAAYFPNSLRRALGQKSLARDALTFVKPGISIHPLTGSTREGYLRFEEMARGGITLTAHCQFREDISGEHLKIISALLISGARLVERVGGKRRRGAGRCELVVNEIKAIEPWLEWIQKHDSPEKPPIKDHGPRAKQDGVEDASGGWERFQLRLQAKSPIVIPARTTGNLVETLDYIPGTYLLSHLSKLLNEPHLQSSIVKGDLLVTNATVEIENHAGRAVPFCLAYPKGELGLAAGRNVSNLFRESGPGRQPKNHRKGYVGAFTGTDQLPAFKEPDVQVETHNVVEDEKQRPTEEVGGVYTYEAIKQGTVLRSELRVRQSVIDRLNRSDPQWTRNLQGEVRIGRASKDDYGRVELSIIELSNEQSSKSLVGSVLTVWLLSDLLLRDDRLCPSASIEQLRKSLEDLLNDGFEQSQVKLKLRDRKEGAALKVRQRRTDSWQVSWGLPRPSLAGLQAGTCVAFVVEGKLDPTRLQEIETSGVGERRAEGYGQICFEDPLVTTELAHLTREANTNAPEVEETFVSSDDTAFEYAQLVQREAALAELRRAVPAFAAKREKRRLALGIDISGGRSKPRISQLGGLRSVVNRLRSATDKTQIIKWIEHLEATPNRADEWPLDSLAHVSELITNELRVWELLELELGSAVITKKGEASLRKELWPEAVRTLVDECIRAQKRQLEEVQQDA